MDCWRHGLGWRKSPLLLVFIYRSSHLYPLRAVTHLSGLVVGHEFLLAHSVYPGGTNFQQPQYCSCRLGARGGGEEEEGSRKGGREKMEQQGKKERGDNWGKHLIGSWSGYKGLFAVWTGRVSQMAHCFSPQPRQTFCSLIHLEPKTVSLDRPNVECG